MGTRCLTVFKDEFDKEIVVLYRQYDGYPKGHGKELKVFLKDRYLVNGIGMNSTRKESNGMGCLAATIVAHFKKDIGGFYLYPGGTRDVGEEYIYTISPDKKGKVKLSIEVAPDYPDGWGSDTNDKVQEVEK